jgi:hypothetical protein
MVYRVFSVLTALAYTALFLSLSSTPLTDAPNHLARSAVMNSLWFDPHSPFQGTFAVNRSFMPYVLPDLGLVATIRIAGVAHAAPIWSTLTMLALVFAVWMYARQFLETNWAMTAAALCSWYLATNYFFILGFFSFQWGVAACFVAVAALETWRRDKKGASICYVIACVLSYGTHLASFAMLVAIVGIVGVIRKKTWLRFGAELLPLALLAGYHILYAPKTPPGISTHSTVADKFGHFLEAMFVRQNYVVDRTILLLFWAILLGAIWFGRRGARRWTLAATSGLAAAIYFILPIGFGGIYYVDERALPFFYVPLLIFALRMLETSQPDRKLLLVACSALAVANLASLASFLPRQNRQVAQYREALHTIPERQNVLPIYTRARDGNTYPLRHAGSFYVADRAGYIPYLFSQITGGGPSGYFSDFSPAYRPPQDWYLNQGQPDWDQVTQCYDYVVITKPWDAKRIERNRLEMLYENPAATVFRVIKPRREL